MKTATVTTFEVSDVERATSPLPEVPYKQAVEALLTKGSPAWEDEWDDEEAMPSSGPKPATPCASVGSTDASASLPARVGVVGPKRAGLAALTAPSGRSQDVMTMR